MNTAAPSTTEADDALAKVLEAHRESAGRPATRRELRRWAKVYRKVARGLERLAGGGKGEAAALDDEEGEG